MKLKIFPFLLLFISVAFSCKKDDEMMIPDMVKVPVIKSVRDAEKPQYEYVYNYSRLISEEKSKYSYTNYNYNEQNQLVTTDYYINEAFAVSHRNEASVSAIREYLPSYAGLHLTEEIKQLSSAVSHPLKPLVLIIGGAKIETKLPVIKQFIGKADYILVGGAVANNFLKAEGVEVGKSLVDNEYLGEAQKILALKIKNYNLFKNYKIKNSKIILPLDWQVQDDKILDIGPATIKFYQDIIRQAKMIIWNGPMGKFEDQRFKIGTEKIAQAIIKSPARVIIGGGETSEILKRKKIPTNVFVSVGGGAMLEFLGGKKLPGL